jgi:hypothetical protein
MEIPGHFSAEIDNARLEIKKWKTLEICAQYELNDNIANSARNIFIAFSKGDPDEATCKAIERDVVVILNYLDDIAIGGRTGPLYRRISSRSP